MRDEQAKDTKVERIHLSQGERIRYVHAVVAKLHALWSDSKVNRSGMRAAFRRWKPGGGIEPTLDMRQHIWGYVGPPPLQKKGDTPEADERNDRPSTPPQAYDEGKIIDEAATLTAMRAVAGDSSGSDPIGAALHKSGISDTRLVRLLTAPMDLRQPAFHRALRFVARKNDVGIGWNFRQVEILRDFLFGTEAQAQRAANLIATDFYRSRGKVEKGEREEALATDKS